MIAGFENFGFHIEDFSKKSDAFTVTHLDSPHIIVVLSAYASEIDTSLAEWRWGKPRHSLSYRYMEDPATQKYETVFHAEMDYASQKLYDIQCWLHDEAAQYGYFIDPKEPLEKGCILYKKGSKRFMLVGEDESGVGSKVIFMDVFESDKEKIKALAQKFPNTFKSRGHSGETTSKCCKPYSTACSMRIAYEIDGIKRYSCAYSSFVFHGLTLDDVMQIFELFKIEKEIK